MKKHELDFLFTRVFYFEMSCKQVPLCMRVSKYVLSVLVGDGNENGLFGWREIGEMVNDGYVIWYLL